LLLAFAFHSDRRQLANATFLNRVQDFQPAITIYNLMEILGQLSFNLAPTTLDKWSSWLIDAYQLADIWPAASQEEVYQAAFRAEIQERPFARMRKHRMAFMDSLVLGLAERTPGVSQIVTWNARHFRNKTMLPVMTPSEFVTALGEE
jgi:hypothetical protein